MVNVSAWWLRWSLHIQHVVCTCVWDMMLYVSAQCLNMNPDICIKPSPKSPHVERFNPRCAATRELLPSQIFIDQSHNDNSSWWALNIAAMTSAVNGRKELFQREGVIAHGKWPLTASDNNRATWPRTKDDAIEKKTTAAILQPIEAQTKSSSVDPVHSRGLEEEDILFLYCREL